MNRKPVIAVVVLVVVVCGFLLVRDPVGAATTVQAAWELVITAVSTVFTSLTTFFQHLFHSS
ncbi:hypothetical protein SAMN05421805_101185 [Saccharopolyspora antimicrobica]|uniref:Uncharacterized protein n=2 Tax=Saccharopolyspora antimicrobica TaxID=455193 RepID=A0A1I4QMP5_9PSEU|nr:hypothetical protein [Saccharopolyspora antimicrobica]RKT88374.1 hypothetical protein ATL45_6808 [Saccharopolyspora antimicrobica]SFM41294.1 hypothetical protein SAMN05421805_101185 [Saccharopolyspora antimicrobica]